VDSFHAGYSVSQLLWESATTGVSPLHAGEVISSTDYFNALWSLCQLLLRRRSAPLQEYLPPFRHVTHPVIANESSTVEHFRITERCLIVVSSFWLLQDWPNRLLSVCDQAKLTSCHFLPDRATQPRWMQDVIRQHLRVRQRGVVAVKQVEQTVQQLTLAGMPVTKAAVRRALGVSESIAINTVLSQRRHASPAEFLEILKKFDTAIAKTSQKRSQQAALVRDYAIFLLSVLLSRSVDVICTMTKADVLDALSRIESSMPANHFGYAVLHKAVEQHAVYATEIRPGFAKLVTEPAWFLSRFGDPVAAHGVRDRLARMIRSTLPQDIWNSADIFLHVLGTAPMGRRAKKRQLQEFDDVGTLHCDV
jgi:hypothetical protein